jgi:uncharacterized damage-inducible protein DinB
MKSNRSENRKARLEGELKGIRNFFAYNAFVRKKYLAFISKLPENVRAKDRGASFPSIVDIFAHVLDAYNCWITAYNTGDACKRWQHRHETEKEEFDELLGLSISQVKEMEERTDRQIDLLLKNLKPEDLAKTFRFTIGSGKSKESYSRNTGEMLWHLIEEELQHRGEMNALLWQDNIDPPVTGWFGWKKTLRK